ncbi:MAG: hypothetical protein LC750_03040 [Actinobacteria bacterium]|nr:hypothetical protein [Actinomycetota bacterium]
MAEVKRCATCGAQNAATAEWCTLCLARFDGAVMRAPAPPPPERELTSELSALTHPEIAQRPEPAEEEPARVDPVAEAEPVVCAEPAASVETEVSVEREVSVEPGVSIEPEPVPELPQASERAAVTEAPPARPSFAQAAAATKLITPPPPAPVSNVPVRFLRDGERVRWVCPTCETPNDIDLPACRICGTVMARLFAAAEEPVKKEKRPIARTLALSAVMPGLGHVAEGVGPVGASRAVLYVWTLGISLLLLIRPPSKGQAIVRGVGVVFALAAAGVWALSMVESQRLAHGDRTPVLPPRTMTWISAGLTLALFLGLAAAAFGRA